MDGAAVTPSDEYKYDNDFGNGWMKTGYAGSGPYKTREWRANEAVVMERNDNFSGEKPSLVRAIYRHVPEGATQRLLLEQGDVDVDKLVVRDCNVDNGPILKRFMPRAMGRANRIQSRTSHVTVSVTEKA